jgi:uncharacterized peroxidase-related enzyme
LKAHVSVTTKSRRGDHTMQRIPAIDAAHSPDKTKALLAIVTKQMGGVPNILATMAQSSATLDGYLGFAGGLAKGSFPAALREQISLAVAGANGCNYCASVHTALGQKLGLSVDETRRNMMGQSSESKTAAVLKLARLIVKDRGRLADADLTAFHAAGYDHASLVELIAHVALNIFTNYFNHIAETEIDFPHVDSELARAA